MTTFKKPYGSRPGARSKFGGGSNAAARSSARPQSRPYSGGPRASGARSGGARTTDAYARASRGGMPQKFDAVCSNCGKACQVPFRPDGQKPVYCKNCFDAPRSAFPAIKRSASAIASTPTGGSGGGEKSIGDLTRQIAAMNTKIDTMLKILQDASPEE